MSSPCLSYLIALQSHLLRQAVLCPQSESTDDSTDAEVRVVNDQNREHLAEIQGSVLRMASRVFSGAYEVRVCHSAVSLLRDQFSSKYA